MIEGWVPPTLTQTRRHQECTPAEKYLTLLRFDLALRVERDRLDLWCVRSPFGFG